MYKKPELKSYSAIDLLEEIGPFQNQYSTTLYTTTGATGVSIDGFITLNPGPPVTYTYTTDDDLPVGESGAAPGAYIRAFVGFDISSLAGKTIVSATLRMYQGTVNETPYGAGSLGDVLVDHVNFGPSLGSDDFTSGTLNIGTLSTDATLETKTLDVKSQVQSDIDTGSSSSQFRLRFTTTADGPPVDTAFFESVDSVVSSRPELVVTYQ